MRASAVLLVAVAACGRGEGQPCDEKDNRCKSGLYCVGYPGPKCLAPAAAESWCRAGEQCKNYGDCVFHPDDEKGRGACVAESQADCRSACEINGLCTFEKAGAALGFGYCHATTITDCVRSRGCTDHLDGACALDPKTKSCIVEPLR